MTLTTEPISEALPGQVLPWIAPAVPRLAEFMESYGDGPLVRLLNLPAVPDDQLQPDISNAKRLMDPEQYLGTLREAYVDDDVKYQQVVQQLVEHKTFVRGVTLQEQLLVAQRYRFARDLKMLSLGAELLEHPVEGAPERATLPSGVEIILDTHQPEQLQDLLQPALWERRTQYKDRVYEVAVNGRKYILKERKTARHTDTKRHGHIDGQTSVNELQTAQQLRDQATVQDGHFSVTWEQPIGAVTFPDGFSFTVFEFMPGLISDTQVTRKLATAIEQHRSEFEAEYDAVLELANQYRDSAAVLRFETAQSEGMLRRLLQWLKLAQKTPPPNLSFEEFARIKAYRMEHQLQNRLEDVQRAQGYRNSDVDGYAYRLKDGPDGLLFEIVGFDFEYYSKMSPEDQADQLQRTARYRQENFRRDQRTGLGFSNWSHFGPVTRMEKAGYLALLALEAQAMGLPTDPQED